MNPNQQPPLHHHQQQQHIYSQQQHSGAPSNSANNNVLVYINNGLGGGGDGPSGNSGGGMVAHNGPMPPAGWVKSHTQHQHHPGGNNMPCGSMNMNRSNCSSTSSNSSVYGASNSYSQQSFYSESHPNNNHHRYNSDGIVNNSPAGPMRENTNYPGSSGTNTSFYPSDPSAPADYYHHESQFNAFDPVKNAGGPGGCGSDESNSSGFYASGNEISSGFYPQSNHHYHHGTNHEYPGEYSRLHYSHNQSGSSGNYFSGPNSRPSSSCSAYGHQHISTPDFHQHPSQMPPFRRNSIESFSTEPGDLPYNSKYGAYNSSNSHALPHHVKREALTPSTSPWSGEHDTSQGQGYFFNGSSNNNSQAQTHPNRNPYNSSICHNNAINSHHQLMHHHHCESPNPLHTFSKSSCAFDDSSGMTGPETPEGAGQYKASPVKHRSHSLSYSARPVNFENPHFNLQTGNNNSNSPIPGHTHPGTPASVPASEIRPGSDSGSNPSQACESDINTFCNDEHVDKGKHDDVASPGEPTSGQIKNGCTNSTSMLERVGGEDSADADADAIAEILESTFPSQSNISDMSIGSNKSSSCHEGHDAVSDLEEELKKEIQNVSTTTGMNDEVSDDKSNAGALKVENEHELSNSSTLALFDTITLNQFSSPAASEPDTARLDMDEDMKAVDDEDSLSGISSFSAHRIHSSHSTCDRSTSSSPSPQKISKRSFSEADKDLVINTSAITAALALHGRGRTSIITVPKGWKREISTSANSHLVFYISPSDTKLRSLDEVKNYITSDGTCKCGLSCPLHLEHAFSFDPKVSNAIREKEENPQNSESVKSETRSCCNHKRKIPISEDSPLISSTRDDLGDFGVRDAETSGESGSKKRRITENHEQGVTVNSTKEETSSSVIEIPKTSPSSALSHGHNVLVPFSQQSPDTTTQTPQRDMSPASSVSSDASAGVFGSGSRSTNSTPTPITVKLSPNGNLMATTPPATGQPQYEFAWPTPPSSAASSTSTGLLLVRPQTPPGAVGFWTSPNITISPGKKPTYQHHLMPKTQGKRPKSPCPNIDVRQIPLLDQNQNRPPLCPPTSSSAKSAPTPPPPVISITPTGASHPIPNPSLSFFPIMPGTSAHGELNNFTNLNTGYSISPILPNASLGNMSTANTLQFANLLPIQAYCQQPMPRLVTSSAPPTNMLIQQSLPSSITISMVGQGQALPNQNISNVTPQTSIILPKLIQKAPASSVDSTEAQSEKSPLQLVQDVVDRVHSNDVVIDLEAENSNEPDKDSTNSTARSETPAESEGKDKQSESTKLEPPASTASTTETELEIIKDVESQTPKSDVIQNLVPLFSSPSITIQPIPTNILSTSSAITTSSTSTNVPIMTSCPVVNCGTTLTSGNPLNVATSNQGLSITTMSNNGNSLILQQPTDQNNQSIRYPFFQTIQPFFLNSGGGQGSLIISPHQSQGTEPQHSFIQLDPNSQTQLTSHPGAAAEILHQTATGTMVLDQSVCGSASLLVGPKKKKKRLSKKQQQQQAQLQLQQQLLLQQLHQQVQQQQQVQAAAAAQQQLPLIFPQSFNLGNPGFSLQPMNMNMNMNFFPTPTILTLPNLILNPADGTLFIQQQPGPPQMTATSKACSTVKLSGQFPIQAGQQHLSNLMVPKKDGVQVSGSLVTGEVIRLNSGESSSDDSSRQNATPDSSTNDCQLGLLASASQGAPITVSLPLGSSTNIIQNKKGPLKSKVVSSSTPTTHKRILPQKQILPKIDSTTTSTENP